MAGVYRQPGIRLTEVTSPNLINVTSGYNTTCIIANGSSTIPFSNVEVTRGSGSTDALPDRLTGEVASIVGVGDVPGYFTNYVQGVDYQLTSGYLVEWLTSNAPVVGSTYYVSYNKTKQTTDYNAIRFFDMDDVRTQYGFELNNGVQSDMAIAALLELEARGDSGSIICIQAVNGSTGAFFDAIDKSENEEFDTIICTGVTNSAVRNYLVNSVSKMSSDSVGKERTTFVSAEGMSDSITTIGALAAAIANDRVSVISHPSIGISIEDKTTQETTRITKSAIYAGANISGIESNADNDPATPMMKKKLSARIDLNDWSYSKKETNYLGSKNAFVLSKDPTTNVVSVYDALTTDNTTYDKAERSVRRLKDRVRKDIRKALEDRYIGQKNLTGIANSIEVSTASLLQNFIDAQIINDAKNIKAKQDSVDPRKILLSFTILPVFPLKYIDITMTISAS